MASLSNIQARHFGCTSSKRVYWSLLFVSSSVGGLLGCSGSDNQTTTEQSGGANAVGGGSAGGGAGVGGNSAASSTGGALGSGGQATVGGNATTGGNVATGGAATGGAATGGAATGGAATGGRAPTGGAAAGGAATGGSVTTATGGAATGGRAPTGGAAAGGAATGGRTAAGGASSGGAATGGRTAAGGAATGGAATGGTTATGGATAAAGSSAVGRSAGCGKASTIPSSQYNNGTTIAITAANMQRRYILNVPTNYDNTKAYRLIFAWHQLDGNDKQMYANGYYHLLNLSANSTIFVAPNGQKNGAPCTGNGNGESGCGWPNTNNSDLALADAVLAQIEQNFCVDTNRIFATGWSYGGSMSYKHACERGLGGTKGGVAGYIRGIAVYSGAQLSGTCTPTQAVAYYASHGTGDTVLSYDMGIGLFQNFATANGCTYATPTKVTSGNHVCTTLTGCKTGYPTEFCSFNGGHTPDPSDGGTSWEYQTVWNFLSPL